MDTYDIWKKDEQWKVEKEGSERAIRSFDTKNEAVSFGRDYLQSHGGHLRIWSAEGDTVQEERIYSLDEGGEPVGRASGAAQKVRPEPEPADVQQSRGLSAGIAKGAADAAEAARRLVPAAGEYLSKGAYGTAYYAAYGVVFTAVAVSRSIPMLAPVARGLHDGSEAAIKAYEEEPSATPEGAAAT
jgi:hypothetical protein